jgi:hypothetical protein
MKVAPQVSGTLKRELLIIAKAISKEIESKGMRTTGQAQASLRVQVVQEGNVLVGRIWGEQYIGALEYGRKPGKMPPVSMLEEWVINKGLASGDDARSMAWAIAIKIAREGTSWLQKAPTGVLSNWINEEVYREIGNAVFGVIADDLKSEVVREFSS